MGLRWPSVLFILLIGCATAHGAGDPAPLPSPEVKPATKKELPWLDVFGGRMRTTLFYGPWQCRKEFMRMCQQECTGQQPQLMGCIWLADIKLDWEGHLVIPPLPIKAGGRLGIFHCCCNYNPLPSAQKELERKRWDGFRESFRESWGKKFGEWPTEGKKAWPGHHIRDLHHGGDPVDPNNIIPTPPRVHDIFNRAYPACYGGQPPWNAVGPNLPYTDN